MELDSLKTEKVVQQMREQSSKESVYWMGVAEAIMELNDRARANLLARAGEAVVR